MEGKDDVGERMLSHGGESDGSPALAGAGRVGGAFELADCRKFCYARQERKRKGNTIYVISTKGEGR